MLLTKQLKDIIKTKKDRFFIKNKKAQRNAVLFCIRKPPDSLVVQLRLLPLNKISPCVRIKYCLQTKFKTQGDKSHE